MGLGAGLRPLPRFNTFSSGLGDTTGVRSCSLGLKQRDVPYSEAARRVTGEDQASTATRHRKKFPFSKEQTYYHGLRGEKRAGVEGGEGRQRGGGGRHGGREFNSELLKQSDERNDLPIAALRTGKSCNTDGSNQGSRGSPKSHREREGGGGEREIERDGERAFLP